MEINNVASLSKDNYIKRLEVEVKRLQSVILLNFQRLGIREADINAALEDGGFNRDGKPKHV